MTTKAFASSADLGEKVQTLEVLADGVYALTAEGDPNIGAIEGEDFVVCFEALATPVAARQWLAKLREHTDKPVKYLILSHYHAVRTLGASAYDAEVVIAHDNTRKLIAERGQQDWDSEYGRMPRLFKEPDTIPGLAWPTQTFSDAVTIDLGGNRGDLQLKFLGRGHTEGDIVAWLPQHKILFTGDLVEAEAALYTGDAFHREWATGTLDAVKALSAELLIGGRGAVARGRDARRRDRADPALPAGHADRGGNGAPAWRNPEGGVPGHARGAVRPLRALADFRTLPAVRCLPRVGRIVRYRAAGHLDRRT